MDQQQLKTIVRGAYDIQKLRIQMGNRIVGNFKAKLGQEAGEKEESLDEDAKDILRNLRVEFKKITDGVKAFPKQKTFEGTEVISSFTELCLVAQYVGLEKHEDEHFKRLGQILREYPIFSEFLDDVSGVGPAMAGVIVSEIDISKAKYPSSLWAYAGLDVARDGGGRSRRKEHLRDVEYEDKDGKPQTKKGITFNPFLKTKLTGVLGPSFLKVRESPYKDAYYDYKHRLESHAKYGVDTDTSKGRRHNMAIRYAVKRFLVDLYVAWRTIEGLPVAEEYSKAKLGIEHAA